MVLDRIGNPLTWVSVIYKLEVIAVRVNISPRLIFTQWISNLEVILARWLHSMGTWASYQIRKTAGCACAGNAGNVSPRHRIQRKLLVSDPGMHHGTCVTHVPWCMSGSLTPGGGENVPGIPGAFASAILRIWQEAHWSYHCPFARGINRSKRQWYGALVFSLLLV